MKTTRIANHAGCCLLGSMLLTACGDDGTDDPTVAAAPENPNAITSPENPSAIASAQCDGSADFCDDFNDGTAARWVPQGGSWEVIDNEYVGSGVLDACNTGFSSNETLIRDLTARNVELRVDMRAEERVDKGIVLRSTGPSDQIELNFRADPFNDLVVQEVVACGLNIIEFVPLETPHLVGQTIAVRVRLVGALLSVWIDDELVFDACVVFQVPASGSLGLAVINGGRSAFDNVQVDVLD